ncbi:hypothetical protein [Glutamicibacter ardleyensis]|uniref:hypothetical protein n=1 Tax=Glutamicibacter ardleyensis TaxID=225894 RepID=UPI003FCF8EF5
MGANEKYEAAMHGFIPATDEVRALYVAGTPAHRVSVHSGYAEFDRWLETVRAEAKAEALTEMAKELENQLAGITRETGQTRSGRDIIRRIRNRANQYKENQ